MTPMLKAGDLRDGFVIATKVAAWALVLVVGGYGLAVSPELRLAAPNDSGPPAPAVPDSTPHAKTVVSPHAAATQDRRKPGIDKSAERSDVSEDWFPVTSDR